MTADDQQESSDTNAIATSLEAVSLNQQDTTSIQYVPSPSSIPKVIAKSFNIRNVQTDIWLQLFVDRVVFGLSQLNGGVIGNYLMCEAVPNVINPRAIEYNVSTLLGSREDRLLEVYARRITELIVTQSSPESGLTGSRHMIVVLGISLDQKNGRDPEMFKTVIGLMLDMYHQATSNSQSQ